MTCDPASSPRPDANPVLVEVTRGGIAESRHRGAIVVSDPAGDRLVSIGDVERAVFPRSAVKALQALPLVESGAADAVGLTPAELALACASHNGEPMHVAAARSMLHKAGLTEAALECGPQWPAREEDFRRLLLAGESGRPVHNNCSGKHAGMLALAVRLGVPTAGYVRPDHPVQQSVRATLCEVTGTDLGAAPCGGDGCSIPTYAIPLAALARAFAAFATGETFAPARAAAAARLSEACFAHPEMVAGTGRTCTRVMAALPGLAFVKGGAEGVVCAALPTRRLGVALKCDDGAGRAADAMLSAVLLELLRDELTAGERELVADCGFAPILDRRGRTVGETRWVGRHLTG